MTAVRQIKFTCDACGLEVVYCGVGLPHGWDEHPGDGVAVQHYCQAHRESGPVAAAQERAKGVDKQREAAAAIARLREPDATREYAGKGASYCEMCGGDCDPRLPLCHVCHLEATEAILGEVYEKVATIEIELADDKCRRCAGCGKVCGEGKHETPLTVAQECAKMPNCNMGPFFLLNPPRDCPDCGGTGKKEKADG